MLLALSAKKRCGKDTVADFMEEDGAVKYALANPIKRFLFQALLQHRLHRDILWESVNGDNDYNREQDLRLKNREAVHILNYMLHLASTEVMISEDTFQKAKRIINEFINYDSFWSVRKLMQYFGTDVMVTVDKMYWMRYMTSAYLDCIEQNKIMVVTDVRQEHELLALREFGAKIIFVTRLNTDIEEDNHITERGLQPLIGTDRFIHNDGTLDELRFNARTTIKYLKDL